MMSGKNLATVVMLSATGFGTAATMQGCGEMFAGILIADAIDTASRRATATSSRPYWSGKPEKYFRTPNGIFSVYPQGVQFVSDDGQEWRSIPYTSVLDTYSWGWLDDHVVIKTTQGQFDYNVRNTSASSLAAEIERRSR